MNSSPFKVAFLLVFAFATLSIATESLAKFHTRAGSAFTADSQGNMTALNVVLVLAGLTFVMHMARVYITLGILEHDEAMRTEFLGALTPWQRFVEFGVRVLLILLVSFKLTPYGTVQSIPRLGMMLMSVYGAMCVWDIVMWAFRNKLEHRYLWTSVIGFVQGMGLWYLAVDPSNENKVAVLLAILATLYVVIIIVLVGDDFLKNRTMYWNYLRGLMPLADAATRPSASEDPQPSK
jgi:hypothetical protein